jgi:CMP-N,N'-diacetyllegionaminic acid synthase
LKSLGIIGARAGSKRVKGKNIRALGGKELVRWTIEAAQKAKAIDRLLVSSDDPKVLDIANEFDSQLPLQRPKELATDTSNVIDYVRHAIEYAEHDSNTFYDTIVIIQPTSPFTLPADIDHTVDLLRTSGADSSVTVMKLDHAIHPIKLKTLEGDRLYPYLEEEHGRMASYELPELYVRNCSVYASRREVIESGQVIGADCRAFVMPQERSVDINSELDFQFAEFMLAQDKSK